MTNIAVSKYFFIMLLVVVAQSSLFRIFLGECLCCIQFRFHLINQDKKFSSKKLSPAISLQLETLLPIAFFCVATLDPESLILHQFFDRLQ
mmetsp:Transcript_9241/g.16826  ORF Transcript_9241/g.16826 Transcript_9241/m.16826 type:complete len:91 (+) Transcript_9241:1715-1987(+)